VHLSICFLSNPLHRFRAPGASTLRVGESGAELRAHMRSWMEWIFSDTALAGQIPDLRVRIRKAGILKEGCISLTPRLDFRVRALGNWAGHFDHPIVPARFGYCPALTEQFGVLWNGDYVFCCTDYDGKTALANFSETPLREYFVLPEVQAVAGGFQRYRVVHPHCRQCLGDRHPVSAFLRQAGSIVYFRLYRRLRDSRGVKREAV
jgi:iron-sulfur cluster protein